MPDFTPPRVWTWDQPSGGKFAAINRPISGPTHDADLPIGDWPLQLYSLATPNGQKVTILLEELLAAGHEGAEYDAWRIDIEQGDQFGSGFVAINPNSKIPALVDLTDPMNPRRLFESGAILLYLAEKFGAFLPAGPADRTEALNWLFWQMGAAPLLGGGFGHFYAYAPEPMEYPLNRYAMEAKRQLDVLDRHLADHSYMAGEYSIADIAIWPWYGQLALGQTYKGADTFLATRDYKNLIRWAEAIAARQPVKRGLLVNKGEGGTRERHSAADVDEALRRAEGERA